MSARQAVAWPARILHVAPFLWSGAGRVITRLAREQARVADVCVSSTGRSGALEDWPAYRHELRAAGVRVVSIDLFHRTPEVFWPGVERLGDLVASLRPQIIHVHSGVPACACAVLADRGQWRGPTVAHLHSWAPGRPRWMDEMDAWGLMRADAVNCPAAAYRARLVSLGVPVSRLHRVPWGADVDVGCLDAPAVAEQPPIIGMLGRIEPRKGQLALVQAMSRLPARHEDVRVELVGPTADSAYAQAIGAEIERRRLDGRIHLAGAVHDPLPHLRRWTALVSASVDEGQGLAVIEAMLLAVPVIARQAAGLEDFLRHDVNAILYPRRASAAGLARAVVSVLDDPAGAAQRAAVARRSAARRFSWERTLSRTARIYQRANAIARRRVVTRRVEAARGRA